MNWIGFGASFFGGLLAGGEVVVRFGVRAPLARLDQHAHITMRQGLIRTLRVLVPILFALAFVSSALMVAMIPSPLHWANAGLLLAFIGVTLAGTVPINKAVATWDPTSPPPAWRQVVRRWERLDDARTLFAATAFALTLLDAAMI